MWKEWRLRHPAAHVGADWAEPSYPGRHEGSVPPIVQQVLRNRGITTQPELESFLRPELYSPMLLPGLEPACYRLREAITTGAGIGIFGDFDVDGVTGTALVAEGLSDLGAKTVPYIPDRMTEGHGPNEAAILALRERGVSVLITVDCGVTSQKELELAREVGMDVIITDHHIPPATPPAALSIIDPKVEGSDYPFPDLSGAGLAFKLVQGLYELWGQPWSRNLLELVALSTVADLVPLTGENRFLVQEGLKELSRTRRPGLLALYRRAGIRPESIGVETVSFMIAPRLNAAGRLEHASASYGLLLTRSPDEAERLASQLEGLNRQRQQLTEEAHIRAREQVLGLPSLPSILLVDGNGCSPGIAGLVASRLVDEFYRPTVVMCPVDGAIRASARSIPEFDVGNALAKCGDLFRRHGGHSQAAGFEMTVESLSHLEERLGAIAQEQLGDRELKPGLDIDAEVAVSDLPGETFRWLKELEPYGMNHPRPTFLTRRLRPMEARSVGAKGRHLRLKLKEGGVIWDAMAFGRGGQWVSGTPLVDVVYTVGAELRDGMELMALKVLDFRPSVT